MTVPLQSLRIPAGWRIGWNSLFELDPTVENVGLGFFGGSSLFLATHGHLRLSLDVEWRPEDDPAGEYRLKVRYARWPRAENGRRIKSGPVDFREAQTVLEFRTRDRAELVRELESALVGRPESVEHT